MVRDGDDDEEDGERSENFSDFEEESWLTQKEKREVR